jgi:hypothetical protein
MCMRPRCTGMLRLLLLLTFVELTASKYSMIFLLRFPPSFGNFLSSILHDDVILPLSSDLMSRP